VNEFNEAIEVFCSDLYLSISCSGHRGTFKHLQHHFVDQNSRHSDLESQQRVPRKRPCPCKCLQHEERVEDIREPSCHHDTAEYISKVRKILGFQLTSFSSSASPLAVIGTAHHKWLARYTALH
jgi:hypothetical protein